MPRIKSTGPKDAKIFIIGEAPNQQDEKSGIPFTGSSGNELQSWLNAVGILKNDCYLTHVFMERPNNNDIKTLCISKRDHHELKKTGEFPLTHSASMAPNLYADPRITEPELQRLYAEIESVSPNIILTLGNTAMWALFGDTGIAKKRGTIIPFIHNGTAYKVLPTYSPSAIIRQWDLRTIAIADCMKLAAESSSADINRVMREVYVPETIPELTELVKELLAGDGIISVDIETKNKQITCIGFSCNIHSALVIPFYDPRKESRSYWNQQEEILAWKIVRDILSTRRPKLGQNFLYDLQYLWAIMHIPTYGEIHDTMLLHHSKFPELEKGLGFLGSIYCNEIAWKTMRPKGEKMETKLDE